MLLLPRPKQTGRRGQEIRKAEGIKQATQFCVQKVKAQAIQLVNEAAEKYFVGNA